VGRIAGLRTFALILLALVGAVNAAATRLEDPAAAKAFLKRFAAVRDPAPEQIKALIKDLAHGEYGVRDKATRRLIAIGEAALPFVEEAAKSDDPEVRCRARSVLGAPRKAAGDVSAELAKAIALLFAAKDKWVVAMLIELLDNPRVDVRYAAEYGLRRLTRQCFEYNAYAEKESRAAAAGKWRQWWKASEAAFAFDRKRPAQPMPAGVLISSRRIGKVWMVSLAGKVVWSKEVEGQLSRAKALSKGRVVWSTEGTRLHGDVLDIERLPNGNTLLAHSSGNRLIEFDKQGKTVWSTRIERMPLAAQRLPNGNTLVCVFYAGRLAREWGLAAGGRDPLPGASGRVVEITRSGEVVWARENLSMPTDAVKLPGGNVLVTEQGRSRVIELDRNGQVVWERKCEGAPNSARRLPDGTTVINDTSKGILLVGRDGKLIRQLDATERAGKLSLVPASAATQKK
jgi:predicted Rdx family selenoprotein